MHPGKQQVMAQGAESLPSVGDLDWNSSAGFWPDLGLTIANSQMAKQQVINISVSFSFTVLLPLPLCVMYMFVSWLNTLKFYSHIKYIYLSINLYMCIAQHGIVLFSGFISFTLMHVYYLHWYNAWFLSDDETNYGLKFNFISSKI